MLFPLAKKPAAWRLKQIASGGKITSSEHFIRFAHHFPKSFDDRSFSGETRGVRLLRLARRAVLPLAANDRLRAERGLA
jgi:hypothetical protein